MVCRYDLGVGKGAAVHAPPVLERDGVEPAKGLEELHRVIPGKVPYLSADVPAFSTRTRFDENIVPPPKRSGPSLQTLDARVPHAQVDNLMVIHLRPILGNSGGYKYVVRKSAR